MHATARAHTNIALIKYWGKKDDQLKLPCNSSLSMTLDAFYTETKLTILDADQPNRFYLNGQEQSLKASQRVVNYLRVLQERFNFSGNFLIESTNHVPTSAGLASSASAFAALAASFNAAYELNVDLTELSRMARLGSGSATRSVYGGFVEWQAGDSDENSIALPLAEHPKMDLTLLAVEIETAKKSISSTKGMNLVVETSPYYATWVEQAELNIGQMKMAIAANDFSAVGHLAQQNALAMHALNLTADPGFTYFQPETIRAMQLVAELNQNGVECYFTMDAGPNVKILTQLKNVEEIIQRFKNDLPHVKIVKATFGPGIEILDK